MLTSSQPFSRFASLIADETTIDLGNHRYRQDSYLKEGTALLVFFFVLHYLLLTVLCVKLGYNQPQGMEMKEGGPQIS